MNTLRLKDIFILGFMNFALFVGAGNIIFPPFIGLQAGTSVWPAAAGFLLTGVGLPVITAIAIAKASGSLTAITQPMGRVLGMVLTILCYLCIGPLFATPRTATVSYELALQSFIGNERGLLLWSLIYFLIVAVISLYPSRLLDTVGKMLSPIKIIALMVLAITALFLPAGKPQEPVGLYKTTAFSQGVINGYLTMDTLAALVFGLVIVNAIKSRGVSSPKQITRYAVFSGAIAGLGLALVYLSLFRLGTSSGELIKDATNGAQVLSAYVRFSYGNIGSMFLGVLITIACMVTAIGLTCASASYFSSITRISYRAYVWLFVIFSMIVSNLGLTQLIKISIPVLTAVYPAFVVLVVTYFFRHRFNSSSRVIAPGVTIALLFGIIDALQGIDTLLLPIKIMHSLPLYDQGLAWALPSGILILIGLMFDKMKVHSNRDN